MHSRSWTPAHTSCHLQLPSLFPRPAIVMVDGSDVHLLRRAETFEDIIALDRVEQPPTNEKRQALQ